MVKTERCILLVEDSEDDVFLFFRAARRAGFAHGLKRVAHGQEALDYLGGLGSYTDRSEHPFPSLMLLDLKLPVLSGLDVLKAVRAAPSTERLPVIVFTSSRESRDVEGAAKLAANAYVCKPSSLDEQVEFVRCVETFWLRFHEC